MRRKGQGTSPQDTRWSSKAWCTESTVMYGVSFGTRGGRGGGGVGGTCVCLFVLLGSKKEFPPLGEVGTAETPWTLLLCMLRRALGKSRRPRLTTNKPSNFVAYWAPCM